MKSVPAPQKHPINAKSNYRLGEVREGGEEGGGGRVGEERLERRGGEGRSEERGGGKIGVGGRCLLPHAQTMYLILPRKGGPHLDAPRKAS